MEVTEVRLKVMPAEVNITNEEKNESAFYGKTSVYVTNRGIHIFVDTPNGPAEDYTSLLTDFSGRSTTGWTATTDDGDVIEFKRSQGCLCGSRLRGFDPFPGVPFTNTLVG